VVLEDDDQRHEEETGDHDGVLEATKWKAKRGSVAAAMIDASETKRVRRDDGR